MTLVTTALLILCQFFARTQRVIQQVANNQVFDTTVTCSIIEIVYYIVHHLAILGQYTDCHIRTHIEQVPVTPVVEGADFTTCMVVEEVLILACEHIEHPFLIDILVSLRPAAISSHDFCGTGEGISLGSSSKYLVGIIGSDFLTLSSPSLKDFHRLFGISLIVGQLPKHRHLISCGSITHGVLIVFTRDTRSCSITANDDFLRISLIVKPHILTGFQTLECFLHLRNGTSSNFRLYSIEIGGSVHCTWVIECICCIDTWVSRSLRQG